MNIEGLKAKLVEKKGKKAEIEIEGQKIIVPSQILPASATSGTSFRIYCMEEEAAKINQKELAKAILEEILNGR